LKEVATTPNDALKILWKARFFFRPKSVTEIKKELENRGYNFSPSSMSHALQRCDFLTRKGKKEGDHLYVQIHPYVEEKKIRVK